MIVTKIFRKQCLLLFILVAVLVGGFIIFKFKFGNRLALSDEQKQIVTIAREKAGSLGYNTRSMKVFFDIGNREWNETFGSMLADKKNPFYNKEYPEVVTHNFQAVHFSPSKKHTLGGSVWVLINIKTGEVIFVQREK